MDFGEAVLELSGLQGQTVLFMVRPVADEAIVFEMLDRIDRVWSDERATYAVFSDAESSVVLREVAFEGTAWEAGWLNGAQDQRQLRIRLGAVDFGFLPS